MEINKKEQPQRHLCFARVLQNKLRDSRSPQCRRSPTIFHDHAPIDLLITDVVMPNMDGPTLVKQVKQKMPDLRVIFISGYAEDRLRQHFLSSDRVEFIPKPFSLKQLAAKVKEVIEHPQRKV